MQIAVIGAGFSGLAICWHLLNSPLAKNSFKITLFDKNGIGGGASGMAAGLLHPFSGAHAKLNWNGLEGFNATQSLLEVASRALGVDVYQKKGILRLALDAFQREDFLKCSQLHQDVHWWEKDVCQSHFPEIVLAPGIWLKNGLSVNCPLYLKGLWQACSQRGAVLVKTQIDDDAELDNFDLIIAALGGGFQYLKKSSNLKLSFVKGQLLELSWPAGMSPLSFPINSSLYLVSHPAKTGCVAGSTFERNYLSPEPDINKASQEILPKVQFLAPRFSESSIIGCQAGIRVAASLHRPIYGKLEKNLWYLTGMGSKGLLYHSLFAGKLALEIVNEYL